MSKGRLSRLIGATAALAIVAVATIIQPVRAQTLTTNRILMPVTPIDGA